MKKIALILLACLMLVGCNNTTSNDRTEKEEEIVEKLDFKKEHKVEDLLSFQIQGIELSRDIEAPIHSSTIYMEDYQKEMGIILKVTNTSNNDIQLENVLEGQIAFDYTDEKAKVKIASQDRTELLDAYTLSSGESASLYLYIAMNESKEIPDDIALTLTIDSKEYPFELKISELTPEKTMKTHGENITTTDGVSVDILETLVTKQIDPSVMDGLYYYYKVQEDTESFIALKLKVTNNGETEKDISKFLGYRLFIDGEGHYFHTGVIIRESADGKSLEQSGTIQPGEEAMVYCLLPVDDSLIDKAMEIRLDTVDGTYYITK